LPFQNKALLPHCIKLISVFCTFFVLSASYGQSEKEVETHFESFLEYEFEDAEKAKKELDLGLSKARKLENNLLLSKGFKYLSWFHEDGANIGKALDAIDSAIYFADLASDTLEIINSNNQKGNLLSDLAYLDSSLVYYFRAHELASLINDQEGLSKTTNNIALVYTDQGEYVEAIDFFHQAIEVGEAIGDKLSVSDAYNNLGGLFTTLEQYEKAMTYHQKALAIREQCDDPERMSSVLLNIGNVYLIRYAFDSARYYFEQSLEIDKQLDDPYGIALNHNNIGLSYFQQNILDSAIHHYTISLAIREELEDPFGLSLSLNNMGEYYKKKGEFNRAVNYCLQAYEITTESNLPYERLTSCECLYNSYESLGQIKKAYFYIKEAVALEEFLNSEEKNKQLTKKEMEFVFHYRELEDSLKQAEILAAKEYEIKSSKLEKEKIAAAKQNQLLLFVIIGVFLLIIAVLVYYQLRKQQKKNALIRDQKEFIQHQKLEIDQSIAYAQKIQDTSLPSKVLSDLFVDNLVIYLPRDVVSGDFYWIEGNEKYSYFSAADCTGHGIPGAFISMMGTILLNEIYNSKQLSKPGDILDELNRLVQLTLKSRTGQQMKDGMDISFCRFNKHTFELDYAGANNPLWVITSRNQLQVNGELIAPNLSGEQHLFEVKADKIPIGKYAVEGASFKTNTIQLEKGDQVYVFSDGFADQFGGERGKKFKYKPFKRLLIETSVLSGEEQKQIILDRFNQWRGDFEQVDDICILGVKV